MISGGMSFRSGQDIGSETWHTVRRPMLPADNIKAAAQWRRVKLDSFFGIEKAVKRKVVCVDLDYYNASDFSIAV